MAYRSICQNCGEEFGHLQSASKAPKNCSPKCARARQGRINQERAAKAKAEVPHELIPCPICSTPFDPQPRGKTQASFRHLRKTCSVQCGTVMGSRSEPKNFRWTGIVPDCDDDLDPIADSRAISDRHWMRALHKDRESRGIPERGISVSRWQKQQGG